MVGEGFRMRQPLPELILEPNPVAGGTAKQRGIISNGVNSQPEGCGCGL